MRSSFLHEISCNIMHFLFIYLFLLGYYTARWPVSSSLFCWHELLRCFVHIVVNVWLTTAGLHPVQCFCCTNSTVWYYVIFLGPAFAFPSREDVDAATMFARIIPKARHCNLSVQLLCWCSLANYIHVQVENVYSSFHKTQTHSRILFCSIGVQCDQVPRWPPWRRRRPALLNWYLPFPMILW
jgi:hypothetical protein